jgi:CelD/BcsL family acetyltransferase involved in cellulose biosynthesis
VPAVALPLAPLDVQVITDAAAAELLRAEWHALLVRSNADQNGLTLTPEWVLTWWSEFGGLGGRQLRLTTFRQGGRLVGLAPLLRRRVWYPPGIPFRRLELLGTGEPPADAICSDYLGVIAERGAEEVVVTSLVMSVRAGLMGGWDEVVLSMMAGDDFLPGRLEEAFAHAGLAVERRILGEAPYIELPASWNEYLRRLSANDRRMVKQSLKAWADSAEGKLERAADRAGLERGKQVLARLHTERWQHAGAFRSPRFVCFHNTIMEWLLDRGELELLTLWVKEEPVAALYGLVWNGKVYFYQSGRRPDLGGRFRPGIVLLALAIQSAIETGRREFDFLYGAERYKKQLAGCSRPLVELRIARSSLRERLRRMAEYGRGPVRAIKRVIQGARGVVSCICSCLGVGRRVK